MMKDQNCGFLDDWIKFLEAGNEDKSRQAIKKDEWEMFLEFNKNCKGNIKNFEDDGCFPSIFDDFLEWKEKN